MRKGGVANRSLRTWGLPLLEDHVAEIKIEQILHPYLNVSDAILLESDRHGVPRTNELRLLGR